MSDFTTKLSKKISSSEKYAEATNLLFKSYILDMIGEPKIPEKQKIKKLISAAQVFYKSSNEKHRKEGATVLSMILDTCATKHPDIIPIAYNMFAFSGNFPNTDLLTKRHPETHFSYNFYSDAQIEFRRDLNTVDELNFTLTDYQRSLWNDLASDDDVITSAPTSAGKTHIILNYLLEKVGGSDGAFAAIIVPTRALISEVAGKIYELAEQLNYLSEIEICTVPKEGDFKDKTFFVMTQERLYEILMRGDISFNYFFLDEAHNIADKSRGVLLHLTIEKMLDDSNPQIIISMPSASYQNSFSSVFNSIEFKKEITSDSPVSKVIMSIVPKGLNLVVSREGTQDTVTIKKGFVGRDVADIVYKLGRGQSNIIYRNRTDYCENMADKIAALIPQEEKNHFLEEAADYIEKFIHEDFSLADNLRKGTAFHYGPLPASVRVMVENLVKDNHIKFIACTSTLAEGVNLPAKNLFLQNPLQPRMMQSAERLEDVKISNITGRAGRMLHHFSGNVFLIDPERWDFQDYFDGEDNEADKIPTYFKTLNEDINKVLDALRGTYNNDENDKYRFYSIANKLIKDFTSERLEETIQADEVSLTTEQKDELSNAVKEAYRSLTVPTFTLEINPTTGYIQQNALFNFLNRLDNYSDWIMPHPRAGNLYEALVKITNLLQDTGVFLPNEGNSIEHISTIAKKWVQGSSLKDIISEQIQWESKLRTVSVNASVRNVIKVINNDVRFRLSNALRCYDLLLTSILIRKDLKFSNTKLHSFIEVGGCDERLISLINTGLSREAAIELHETLPRSVSVATLGDLLSILRSDGLGEIHPITKKEISHLFNTAN
ncbi:DEAD/DEAH box helicase [uncultured Pelagimonas sp.]|uniref:DEAD/DEAH box helicase n=1 Tax=uncultured Pelagimonas sp. TaxID=1618102 RepID=UPI002614182E|nr:DEAD/DEAH box helicase [uncultured Pelagimonas sp.]